MKKVIINPHLMLTIFFTLIIWGSAGHVKAQAEKRINQTIIIKNGDTIINGKKLSEANLQEKIRLRKEFRDMKSRMKDSDLQAENDNLPDQGSGIHKKVIITKKGDKPHILRWDDGEFDLRDNIPGELYMFKFHGDSSLTFDLNADTIMKQFRFKIDGLDSLPERIITMHRNLSPKSPGIPRMPARPTPPSAFNFERAELPTMSKQNNSSTLSYHSIDKNGISSRMSIRLSEIDKSQLKSILEVEPGDQTLEVKDLTLFPNFSNGKIGISFNLNSKGQIKIVIMDSNKKPVFTDEVANFNVNYMKQISIPENGIYYISVKQNNLWFAKKLVKE